MGLIYGMLEVAATILVFVGIGAAFFIWLKLP